MKETTMRAQRSAARRRRQTAFTLIELLVVVTIIGILAMMIIPQVVGRIGASRQSVATANIQTLQNMVLQFQIDCGRLPTPQEGLRALVQAPAGLSEKWKGPYAKPKDILDPWGVEYMFVSPGRHNVDFDLFTYGADKQEGGEGENADIGNW